MKGGGERSKEDEEEGRLGGKQRRERKDNCGVTTLRCLTSCVLRFQTLRAGGLGERNCQKSCQGFMGRSRVPSPRSTFQALLVAFLEQFAGVETGIRSQKASGQVRGGMLV